MKTVEHIVAKVEIEHHGHFRILPQCFRKGSATVASKSGERLKNKDQGSRLTTVYKLFTKYGISILGTPALQIYEGKTRSIK